MKKILYLLLVSVSTGVHAASVKRASMPTKQSTKITTVTKSKTPTRTKKTGVGSATGSTTTSVSSAPGAKPTMSSAATTTSASSPGNLQVSSGALSAGGSDSSSGSGVGGVGYGSGGTIVANAYTVQPKDHNPPYTGQQIVDFMHTLATQGYTSLFNASGEGEGLNDTSLDKIKKGNFGIYVKNKFIPVSHGALNKNQRMYANYLTTGVYKINQNILREAIKEGTFAKNMLSDRLLIQEFFLGRLAVAMQAMAQGKALGGGQKGLKALSDTVGQRLKQTRYLRNGVEAVSTAGAINIKESPTFSPVDFFVGVIVVNNSTGGIQQGNLAVVPGTVGFLPVPKTSYMNNWSNVTSSSSSGLPSREPMTLGILGGKGGGAIALTPSQDQRTMTIHFSGKSYGPESFGEGQMEAFFQDFSPWGLIIEVAESGVPFVVGLAKMSPGDFGQYLNLDGSVMFSSSDSPTGSTGVQGTSAYSLGDVIDAPYTLYRQTYQKSKTGSGKRYISNNYPLEDWVAQGLFNGQLELSTYQQLARPQVTSAVYGFKVNPKTHKKERVMTAPAKYAYPLFVPQSVGLVHKHATGPQIPQILADGSGIDWLFLRSLRITKAILSLSGITTKLLSALDKNGDYLFRQVLQDPNQDIVVQSTGEFGQAQGAGQQSTGAGSTTQVSGASLLTSFGNSSTNLSGNSTQPVPKQIKRSRVQRSKKAVRPAAQQLTPQLKDLSEGKSPMLQGDVLYIGRTTKYLPLILTSDAHDARGHSVQQKSLYVPGENSLRGLSSRQAYIKGYQKGKQSAKINKSLGRSVQQTTYHDATLHKDNQSTILPSSQRGRDGEPNNTTHSTNFNSLGSSNLETNRGRTQSRSTNVNNFNTGKSGNSFNNLNTLPSNQKHL